MPNDETLQQAAFVQGVSPRTLIPVRGPSGRLYGMLDPQTMTIEFKWPGKPAERIDLNQYRIQKGKRDE